MSESSEVWAVLKKHFDGEGDWVRVENPASPGTPDVNYCWVDQSTPAPHYQPRHEGWMELKIIAKLPAEGRIFRVPHFRPEQRVWIERRSRAGGNVWMLVRVREPALWILLSGAFVKYVNVVTVARLKQYATVWSEGVRFPYAEIANALAQGSRAADDRIRARLRALDAKD